VASTNPGGQITSFGLPIAGLISQADSPAPGPADLIAAGVAVCVVGLAMLANAGVITLPPRPAYDFSAAGGAAGTATLSTFRSMIAEAKPSKGGRRFDIAFGKAPEVVTFALAFGLSPLTLPWLYWPDWMITDKKGDLIRTVQQRKSERQDKIKSVWAG
jgi:hypothetical protein